MDKWNYFLNPIIIFIAGKWFCHGWAWLIETYYAMKWVVDMILKTQHLHSLYNTLPFIYDNQRSCLHIYLAYLIGFYMNKYDRI